MNYFNFTMIILTSFLLIQMSYAYTCNFKCLTCDASDSSKCLTCDGTRQLVGTACNCKFGFIETNLNTQQCLQCTPECETCTLTDRTVCLSCGNSAITHRQLINGKCNCKAGYREVPWEYNCGSSSYDINQYSFSQQVRNQGMK